MKKIIVFTSAMLCGFLAHAADHPSDQNAAKSLEQIAAEVQPLLTKERIHSRFELLRRLQKEGLTWQPTLLAPNDLVDKLDEPGLRFYAGVKLLDALYAATFMQKQAAAEAIQTLEAINDKLDLRSQADLSGDFFKTLKTAASSPENLEIEPLIDRLATDYVKDIPPLMSNPKTAEYLLDSLYGATIQTGYLFGQFHLSQGSMNKDWMAALRKPDTGITEWMKTLLSLYEAAGRSHETLPIDGQAVEKMALIRDIIANRTASDMSPEALRQARDATYAQSAAIRSAMLRPMP